MPLPGGMGSPKGDGLSVDRWATVSSSDTLTPCAVRCSKCLRVGLVAFEGGWNLAKSDDLMNGRVIRGDCGYCGRRSVELVPIPHLTESDKKELRQLYAIQETLEEAVKRGWKVGPKSLILPKAWIEDRMKEASP